MIIKHIIKCVAFGAVCGTVITSIPILYMLSQGKFMYFFPFTAHQIKVNQAVVNNHLHIFVPALFLAYILPALLVNRVIKLKF